MRNAAHIFVGVQIKTRGEAAQMANAFIEHGFATVDLSHDELSKQHIRYMVGGHSPLAQDERLLRFEFPERPGALMKFLSSMAPNWNISLFHYRNQGADYELDSRRHPGAGIGERRVRAIPRDAWVIRGGTKARTPSTSCSWPDARMAFTLDDKLVVAISSRALFDFEEENEVYEAGDLREYEALQRSRLNVPAKPGIAFSLIEKLLALNVDGERRVEVVILSRSDPISGLRAFSSCKEHGLAIERGVFTRGGSPFRLSGAVSRVAVSIGEFGRCPRCPRRRLSRRDGRAASAACREPVS